MTHPISFEDELNSILNKPVVVLPPPPATNEAAYPPIPKEVIDKYMPDILSAHEADCQRRVVEELKRYEQHMITEWERLCEDVRTTNLGNSSKGKKDNFLDGAESMLTAAQYFRHIKELEKGQTHE